LKKPKPTVQFMPKNKDIQIDDYIEKENQIYKNKVTRSSVLLYNSFTNKSFSNWPKVAPQDHKNILFEVLKDKKKEVPEDTPLSNKEQEPGQVEEKQKIQDNIHDLLDSNIMKRFNQISPSDFSNGLRSSLARLNPRQNRDRAIHSKTQTSKPKKS
jgi:hypothetical protein